MKIKEKSKSVLIEKPSVVVPLDEYESMKETMEILADTELVKSISNSLREKKSDRISHDKVIRSK